MQATERLLRRGGMLLIYCKACRASQASALSCWLTRSVSILHLGRPATTNRAANQACSCPMHLCKPSCIYALRITHVRLTRLAGFLSAWDGLVVVVALKFASLPPFFSFFPTCPCGRITPCRRVTKTAYCSASNHTLGSAPTAL